MREEQWCRGGRVGKALDMCVANDACSGDQRSAQALRRGLSEIARAIARASHRYINYHRGARISSRITVAMAAHVSSRHI